MPQSNDARTAQLHDLPEHNAESAAASHNKVPHLSAHEETIQAKDHSREKEDLAVKLTHGKAESIAREKRKE